MDLYTCMLHKSLIDTFFEIYMWGPYCETLWLQASAIFSSTECSGGLTSLNYSCVSFFLLYGEFELQYIYMLFF